MKKKTRLVYNRKNFKTKLFLQNVQEITNFTFLYFLIGEMIKINR